jgi:RNA 2',3'-cyclic 3'-phosphodiesterase
MRTFIALRLPAGVIGMLAEIQCRLKGHGVVIRWVRPQNIHLTLKFLGDISQSQVETVVDKMHKTGASCLPFTLVTAGLGVFPGIKRPRVLWAGLSGDTGKLGVLYQILAEQLATAGFLSEKRPFRGHLTLGRIKDRIDSKVLAKAMADVGGLKSEVFKIDEIVLFKSDLRPKGAVYTEIECVSLTGTATTV